MLGRIIFAIMTCGSVIFVLGANYSKERSLDYPSAVVANPMKINQEQFLYKNHMINDTAYAVGNVKP